MLEKPSSPTAPPPSRPLNVSGIPGADMEPVNTALVNGVWQTDGSRHCVSDKLMSGVEIGPSISLPARNRRRTFKVLYLFSGIERKASIADYMRKLCEKEGFGLEFWEVDILIHGKEDDMLDKDSQAKYLEKIESGDFDVQMLSPPSGTWSRGNFSNNAGPKPCRDRQHPWGKPNMPRHQRGRAERGNELIHFRSGPSRRLRMRIPEASGRRPSWNTPKIWARCTRASRPRSGSCPKPG